MNTKTLDRGGQHYESPALDLIEIEVENIICQDSGKFNLPAWLEEEDDLGF